MLCVIDRVPRGICSPTLAVASSEPLTSSGGPLRSGQQLLTKLSCSLIFFTCSPVAASHARTDLSGDALSTRSPSVVHCTSRTAFLCPAHHIEVLPRRVLSVRVSKYLIKVTCVRGLVWRCAQHPLAVCRPLHLQDGDLVPCTALNSFMRVYVSVQMSCCSTKALCMRTELSRDALSTCSPSVVHCTYRTAFLCPAWRTCHFMSMPCSV